MARNRTIGGIPDTVQLGQTGVILRDNAGQGEVRNPANTALAPMAVATPVANDDAATKEYVDALAGGGRVRQEDFAEVTALVTNAGGAGWVTLLSVNMTTSSGGEILAFFSTSFTQTGSLSGSGEFRLRVDTVVQRRTGSNVSVLSEPQSAALVFKTSGLSAGSHVVEIQWRNTGVPVSSLQINPLVVTPATHASLIVQEVGSTLGGAGGINNIDASGMADVRGHWNFDGNLDDSSGFGFDLTAVEPDPRFVTIDGCQSLFCREGAPQQVFQKSAESQLVITGALTIHVLAYVTNAVPSATNTFIKYGGVGESSPTNFVYDFGLEVGTGRLRFFTETGGGTNQETLIEMGAMTGRWTLYTLTRSAAGLVSIYLNGALIVGGIAHGVPAGGGAAGNFLEVADIGPQGFLGGIVLDADLQTAAEVLAVAQQVGVAA